MLSKLRVKGFKSWADTGDLRLAPLTGLFGTNSSGKTSILQVLLMLKQTAESSDRKRVLHTGDERSPVDLGDYGSIMHNYDMDSDLCFDVSWGLPQPLKIKDPEQRDVLLEETNALAFHAILRRAMTANVREKLGYPVVTELTYSLASGSRFGMTRTSRLGVKDEYDLVAECERYKAKRTPGRAWRLPAPVKCYGFPDEAVGYYQNTGFLPDLTLAFEKMCDRLFYLGPLREYPRRSYVWTGEKPSDVGRRGELAVPALLASRDPKMLISRGQGRRRQSVEERVAEWLREMGMIHSFSLSPIAENHREYELRIKRSKSSVPVLLTDVGFGVSQVLPVLVLCYYVPEGSTVLLEQPEIHLHPFVQAFLADVLIDATRRRNIQVIVESHSEHLLRRLQRRIAEEEVSHDDTALYFCRQQDGRSVAETLDVDMLGNIKNWPKDFFGDEMGELAAMTEAAMRRKEAGQ